MTERYVYGDITTDDADILVNTVNTIGIMGKGVALCFKKRWPSIMKDYTIACYDGRMKPGGCLLFTLPGDYTRPRYWAALATKKLWREPSQYTWVETGLIELRKLAESVNAKSIAIPPPGCGNGGLLWDIVKPMVLTHLEPFDVRIYLGSQKV